MNRKIREGYNNDIIHSTSSPQINLSNVLELTDVRILYKIKALRVILKYMCWLDLISPLSRFIAYRCMQSSFYLEKKSLFYFCVDEMGLT